MAVPRVVPRVAFVLFLLQTLAIHIQSATAQTPVELKWSSNPYGPDGPWNVVEIEIGLNNDAQHMSFFPGGIFQTSVPTTKLCSENQTTRCFASYNQDNSEKFSGTDSGIAFQSAPQSYSKGLTVMGEDMPSWVDDFNLLDGGASVPSVSMSLMDHVFIEYPNGDWYPPIAGCLSVGAPDVNQSYDTGGSGPPVNASIISGYLWEHDETSSNSFSMHIGSVTPTIPGSLIYGGYDRRRVIGDILTVKGASYRDPLVLADLAITVFQGESPFKFGKKKEGILAKGNDTISNGLRVSLDGCSPYLALPESTCENLADHLPISYDSGLGLYLWDTDHDDFRRIMGSASGLTFSLTGDGSSDTIDISVPFQHLNLTLTEPLVKNPTQYLPCSRGGTGHYVLGRAFLQDAFVGGNWNKDLVWIAQGPGPDGVMTRDIFDIEDGDTKLESNDNKWLDTWTKYWDGLDMGVDTGGVKSESESEDDSGGLSIGAKVGIGVGVSLGAIALVAAIVFVLWRKKKRAPEQTVGVEPMAQQQPHNGAYNGAYNGGAYHDNVAESRVIPELYNEDSWKGPTQAMWGQPVEVPATPVRPRAAS